VPVWAYQSLTIYRSPWREGVGRRYFRTWRHVLLCSAGIILLLSSGCATFKELNTKQNARKKLLHSRELLAKEDYKGALEENRKVLSLSIKEPPGDEALFNMALISAHYANPEKDYKESIKFFTELISNYPQSPYVEQTKIWLDVLTIIEKAKQVDIDIEEKKKEIKE
jgi:outer membrane protein assembly factor BamD (BamD/ComL family)